MPSKHAREGLKTSFWRLDPQWDPLVPKVLRYENHPYIIYTKRPKCSGKLPHGSYATNNFGFEGTQDVSFEKKQGCLRVLCVGGSTTEMADGDDPDNTYPHWLEKYLKEKLGDSIEVLNAGCAGYTSAEILIDFELRLLDFHPDAVVIYESINDAWCTGILEGFKSDYSHARINKELKPNAWNKIPHFNHSFFYSLLRKKIVYRFGHAVSLISFINKFPLKVRGEFTPQAPETFKRNIKSLCQVALGHGILPVIVRFNYNPVIEQGKAIDFLRIFENGEQHKDIFLKTFKANIASLKEVATEIPEVVYVEVQGMEEKDFLFNDSCHFSTEGMKKMGEQIATQLAVILKK
ncbi:MAG: SGNH/GDSL hydrolase family protein [Candidatus Omnitrophica bacterium]|nr:SGNH/GDSL hydrolase family protein [Candidatus Omnitrophota bacterium]